MRRIELGHAIPAALSLILVPPLAGQARPPRPTTSVHFSPEAGRALRALWDSSVAAQQERVACLGATVRNDSVLVDRILILASSAADSVSIDSDASIERCGPPEWAGTVHSHVAEYSDGLPSATFSTPDRGVMRRWHQRWHADGVFCLVYSGRDAHCEADGIVGGLRSTPRVME